LVARIWYNIYKAAPEMKPSSRFLLIVIGTIWAGEDLHHLVAKNFARVAESLEGVAEHDQHPELELFGGLQLRDMGRIGFGLFLKYEIPLCLQDAWMDT
jgi:hypothetical protein